MGTPTTIPCLEHNQAGERSMLFRRSGLASVSFRYVVPLRLGPTSCTLCEEFERGCLHHYSPDWRRASRKLTSLGKREGRLVSSAGTNYHAVKQQNLFYDDRCPLPRGGLKFLQQSQQFVVARSQHEVIRQGFMIAKDDMFCPTKNKAGRIFPPPIDVVSASAVAQPWCVRNKCERVGCGRDVNRPQWTVLQKRRHNRDAAPYSLICGNSAGGKEAADVRDHEKA